MKKQKLTKEAKEFFAKSSMYMPTIYQPCEVYRRVKGEWIGRTKGKFYEVKVMEQRPVNHYKRLCDMYTKGYSLDFLKRYVQEVIELSNMGDDNIIGGIKLEKYD